MRSAVDRFNAEIDYTELAAALQAQVSTDGNPEFDGIKMDPALGAAPAWLEGHVFYDDTDKTLAVHTINNSTIQLGQEGMLPPCNNNSGVDIGNGKVVCSNGVAGGRLGIKTASASVEAEADNVLGLVTHTIANGAEGLVTARGYVRGLDTTGGAEAWSNGMRLYLSTVSGELTKAQPSAPDHGIPIAVVLYAHATAGVLLVDITGKWSHLDKLHDVLISGVADGEVLTWDAAASVWKNVAPSSGGGIPELTLADNHGDMTIANGANLTSNSIGASLIELVCNSNNSQVQNSQCDGPRAEWVAVPAPGASVVLTGRIRISNAPTTSYHVVALYIGADEDDPGTTGTGSFDYIIAGMGYNWQGSGGHEIATRRGSPAQVSGDLARTAGTVGDWTWFRIIVDPASTTCALWFNLDTGATEPTTGWVECPGASGTRIRTNDPIIGAGKFRAGVQATTWNTAGTLKIECSHLTLSGAELP